MSTNFDYFFFFFFKQKTAYEIVSGDWSSDVCSSDLSRGQLQVPDHDVYFTIGETVGTPGARFPDCGRSWVHIHPPVFLDQWPFRPRCDAAPFTTVSSWHGHEYILEGDGFWDNNKRVSWLSLLELPKRIDQPRVIATFFGHKD